MFSHFIFSIVPANNLFFILCSSCKCYPISTRAKHFFYFLDIFYWAHCCPYSRTLGQFLAFFWWGVQDEILGNKEPIADNFYVYSIYIFCVLMNLEISFSLCSIHLGLVFFIIAPDLDTRTLIHGSPSPPFFLSHQFTAVPS